MYRYHKKLGFPETLILPEEIDLDVRYSKHALKRLNRLPKGKVLPKKVKLKRTSIVEVYTENKIEPKIILMRKGYSKDKDICFVLALIPRKFQKAKAITFWLNDKKKKNFKKSNYDRA